jgi:hypothetical protein
MELKATLAIEEEELAFILASIVAFERNIASLKVARHTTHSPTDKAAHKYSSHHDNMGQDESIHMHEAEDMHSYSSVSDVPMQAITTTTTKHYSVTTFIPLDPKTRNEYNSTNSFERAESVQTEEFRIYDDKNPWYKRAKKRKNDFSNNNYVADLPQLSKGQMNFYDDQLD